jgi:hypothetical protein
MENDLFPQKSFPPVENFSPNFLRKLAYSKLPNFSVFANSLKNFGAINDQ